MKTSQKGKTITQARKKPDYPVYRGVEALTIILETGILWYANKTIFHLLGFKLLIDAENGEWMVEDHRKYPNTAFTPQAYRTGQAAFQRYLQEQLEEHERLRQAEIKRAEAADPIDTNPTVATPRAGVQRGRSVRSRLNKIDGQENAGTGGDTG